MGNIKLEEKLFKALMREYAERYLIPTIEANYPSFDEDEVEFIASLFKELLKTNSVEKIGEKAFQKIKSNIIGTINEYTADLGFINNKDSIKGFAVFRIKYFLDSFDTLVDNIIDEYDSNEENALSMSFMRTIIDEYDGPKKYDMIIINIDNNGRYCISDNGEDITKQVIGDVMLRYSGYILPEEAIINELSAYPPNSISIHNKSNAKNSILESTLSTLFEGRFNITD
jgi:hypothetical protein